MAYELSQENQAKLREIVKRYPEPRSAILPGLHLVHSEVGWVGKEACDHVAEVIGVPPINVYEALTFYTYFPQKPTGKYHIQICHNISCNLRGAEALIEQLDQKHGIKVGETTKDGLFTLTKAECLGACGNSPMMQVNDDYHENLSPESLDQLIESFRKEAGNGHA